MFLESKYNKRLEIAVIFKSRRSYTGLVLEINHQKK